MEGWLTLSSLKQVAKEAGVSTTAVRGWLERANLDGECWSEVRRSYSIPDEIKDQIIAHYKGANLGGELRGEPRGELHRTYADDLIEKYKEENAFLREQIQRLYGLLEQSMSATDAAQKRLGEQHALQAAEKMLEAGEGADVQESTGAQQSPPPKAKRRVVRDFVSRLLGR